MYVIYMYAYKLKIPLFFFAINVDNDADTKVRITKHLALTIILFQSIKFIWPGRERPNSNLRTFRCPICSVHYKLVPLQMVRCCVMSVKFRPSRCYYHFDLRLNAKLRENFYILSRIRWK